LIAAVAVVATAVLTLNVTQNNLAHQRTERAETESGIGRTVLKYGLTHLAWSGVGTVLRAKADADTSLLLTDLDGAPVAASSPGASTATRPSAVLNPLNTVIADAKSAIPRGRRDLALPAVLLAGLPGAAELRTVVRASDEPQFCARGNVDLRPYVRNGALPSPVVLVSECPAPARVPSGGVDSARDVVELQNAVALDEDRCLVRRQVAAALARTGLPEHLGAPYVYTVSILDSSAPGLRAAWEDCATAALTRHVRQQVAPGALLYLVETHAGSRGIIDRIGRIRLAIAVGILLLVVLGASLLASRQVLRPVRRLTAATRAMAGGALSSRVDATGHGEVADLGRSFNDMADALTSAEDQRRRLVDDIAHELRSPLANIRGYLEAGQDGVLDRDDAWTSSLLEEAALLEHVIEDLQVLAMADAGRLRAEIDSTDLAATVDLAIQACAGAARARLVRMERTGDRPSVPHDRLRMRQVIGNLLTNAIRHAPPESVVTISLESGPPARLVVRDHGPGIESQHLPHVFDRFYRADSSRSRHTGGSGLGLAIVAQLVETHGGSVTAGNHPHGGAVFTVVLPAVA
jgi:two-component system sensor histidine kinase BaeS